MGNRRMLFFCKLLELTLSTFLFDLFEKIGE